MLRSVPCRAGALSFCVLLLTALPAVAQSSPRCSASDPECRPNVEKAAGAKLGDGSLDSWVSDVSPAEGGAPEPRPVEYSVEACQYRAVPEAFDRSKILADDMDPPRRAVHYIRNCGGGDAYLFYVPGTTEPTDDAVVSGLVERARDSIRPPVPQVVTSPPLGSEVLTGMPMYLAVDDPAFREQTGSVSAGQFTVTATVRPVSSWFSPGDQHEPVVCDGPGSVWSHGERPSGEECTHTFTHTPAHLNGAGVAFTLTSRVIYEASYTVEGPILAGTYELGTFEGPETAVDIPVVERRAVRTSTNG